MQKKYDIIIIGAGPGGLGAAKELALNGKSVLVLEQNKVIGPKVCAGGLTLKDFKLGLSPGIVSKKFNSMTIKTSYGSRRVKSDKVFIATVSRNKLGQYMAKEAKNAGAQIITDTKVTKIDKKYVITNSGQKYYFNYLIGADGSNSKVRRYLGIETEKIVIALQYKVKKIYTDIEIFLDAKNFGIGYAWIFPHQKFTSIGCGLDPKFSISAKELQISFKKWLAKNMIVYDDSEYEASIINYDYRGHHFDNFFLVGDAAGISSGLTGEGIYSAIKSGVEVAKKIIDPKYDEVGIKEILKTKKRHERYAQIFSQNRFLLELKYLYVGLMLRAKKFDHRVIHLSG